eukprot:367713_1
MRHAPSSVTAVLRCNAPRCIEQNDPLLPHPSCIDICSLFNTLSSLYRKNRRNTWPSLYLHPLGYYNAAPAVKGHRIIIINPSTHARQPTRLRNSCVIDCGVRGNREINIGMI